MRQVLTKIRHTLTFLVILRNTTKIESQTILIVFIYHALNSSSSGESSYASDDFYGLMDANEGKSLFF
jgi:hypothetical protein